MKTRSEIEGTMKPSKPILAEKLSVKETGIFGSFVSGKESEGSDVDIFADAFKLSLLLVFARFLSQWKTMP